jgi:NADH-quinone oxidoreductase subunit H
MISYEVSLGMSLVPVLLLSGNVAMPEIVASQQGWQAGPPSWGVWFVFPLMVSCLVFVISGLAETNRIPFDLPEAEGELVGGYHTEYSAMKFGMFFLGEYAHMITTAALITTFFLGGWDIPFTRWDNVRVLANGTVIGDPTVWKSLATFATFTLKTWLIVFFFMWIRWTIPRFRYDQLMDLGWKIVLPGMMVYVMLVALVVFLTDDAGLGTSLAASGVLTVVSAVAMGALLFVLDRGFVVKGATARTRRPHMGRPGAVPPMEESEAN